MSKKIRIPMLVTSAMWAFVMLFMLFVRTGHDTGFSLWSYISANTNLIPFATISDYLKRFFDGDINSSTVYINLIGNIVLFIPLGVILPYFSEKCRKILPCLMYSALTMAAVEVLQVLFRCGSCDIDDVILNTFGALIGFGIYSLAVKVLKKA